MLGYFGHETSDAVVFGQTGEGAVCFPWLSSLTFTVRLTAHCEWVSVSN